jgi:hypothetical protein
MSNFYPADTKADAARRQGAEALGRRIFKSFPGAATRTPEVEAGFTRAAASASLRDLQRLQSGGHGISELAREKAAAASASLGLPVLHKSAASTPTARPTFQPDIAELHASGRVTRKSIEADRGGPASGNYSHTPHVVDIPKSREPDAQLWQDIRTIDPSLPTTLAGLKAAISRLPSRAARSAYLWDSPEPRILRLRQSINAMRARLGPDAYDRIMGWLDASDFYAHVGSVDQDKDSDETSPWRDSPRDTRVEGIGTNNGSAPAKGFFNAKHLFTT